jgi:hypothetical protein
MQLSLTQVRAKLGKLVVKVEKGKRPIAITQGSKIKAVFGKRGMVQPSEGGIGGEM